MVAEGFSFLRSQRNDSTLVSPYPTAFDKNQDITTPGKSDKYIRELRAALNTRGLLQHVLERAPTMQDIANANPQLGGTDIDIIHRQLLEQRQIAMRAASAAMAPTISGLSLDFGLGVRTGSPQSLRLGLKPRSRASRRRSLSSSRC